MTRLNKLLKANFQLFEPLVYSNHFLIHLGISNK